MILPDLISTDELATVLDCKPETIQARAQAGVLPGVKFGRGWVFPRDALLQALNQQAREQAEARRAALKPAPTAVALGRRARQALPVLPDLARLNGEPEQKSRPPAEPGSRPKRPGGP